MKLKIIKYDTLIVVRFETLRDLRESLFRALFCSKKSWVEAKKIMIQRKDYRTVAIFFHGYELINFKKNFVEYYNKREGDFFKILNKTTAHVDHFDYIAVVRKDHEYLEHEVVHHIFATNKVYRRESLKLIRKLKYINIAKKIMGQVLKYPQLDVEEEMVAYCTTKLHRSFSNIINIKENKQILYDLYALFAKHSGKYRHIFKQFKGR